MDMPVSGIGAAQGIQAIFTITGNIDIPGGMIFTQMPFGITRNMAGSWGTTGLLPQEVLEKRCGIDEYPMFRFRLLHVSPDASFEACEAGRCKAIWVQSSNPLTSMGDGVERWRKIFRNLEFCAVVDLFMTPTAQEAADIFLPITCCRMRLRAQPLFSACSVLESVSAKPTCMEQSWVPERG